MYKFHFLVHFLVAAAAEGLEGRRRVQRPFARDNSCYSMPSAEWAVTAPGEGQAPGEIDRGCEYSEHRSANCLTERWANLVTWSMFSSAHSETEKRGLFARSPVWLLAAIVLFLAPSAFAQTVGNPLDRPEYRKFWNPVVGRGSLYESSEKDSGREEQEPGNSGRGEAKHRRQGCLLDRVCTR